jgi:peptidoglycan/xylan/chitin deacetylase (PgdA/CDA1 family)
MRKIPRFISNQVGRIIPAKSLFKISTPVFLPFYHVVSDEKLPHILNYNYRSIVQFEQELDFYLKYFKPVSLKYLVENKGIKENVFHLSFDDGLNECAEVIAPILLRKGIPATFFVNTGFVGNKKLFHKYKASLIFGELHKNSNPIVEKLLAENNLNGSAILKAEFSQTKILDEIAEMLDINFNHFLETQKPYLTTEQLIKLKKEGFSIGAHSVDHPEFYAISEEKQLEQVKKSMNWLNENIQPEIKTFAFPFTDFGISAFILEILQKDQLCDITFGTAGLKNDNFEAHLQRYPVEIPGNFVENLKGEWVYFQLRKWIGKATVIH